MPSFSIIICTHNPDYTLLQRLFTNVLLLEGRGIVYEIILIDNHSYPRLAEQAMVQNFLQKAANARLIEESRPGLTHARIAGIQASRYDWLIFFDDDNEPAKDYLLSANNLINKYPEAGAWGAGNIDVVYTGIAKETKFLKKIKWLFQQRNFASTHLDNNTTEGSIYYPVGTGMIVKREVLDIYANKVKSGLFTMSDRKGGSLMSAGDTQILYTCLKCGYYAGTSPSLSLKHLINARKANHSYACRVLYALNSSQLKAYHEVFYTKKFAGDPIKNRVVLRIIYHSIRTYKLNREKYSLRMFLSKKLGELNARIIADEGQVKPILLVLFEKIIGHR